MVDLKPIILYSHLTTPNPIKVAIILHELGVKFEHRAVDLAKIKDEPYISINPNGRVPALEDPNTGIKVWEVRESMSLTVDWAALTIHSQEPALSIFSTTTTRKAESSTLRARRSTTPHRGSKHCHTSRELVAALTLALGTSR